jgi:DNA-binding LacI/PurR family transcriptional regulator
VARTLDELAALSGVSRATVSRVINGGQVSDATRRKVTEVIERTKFRPNAAARTLASGRSGVVGVVIHVSPHQLFQDPYFASLLQGIADALAEHATGMMLWLGNRSKEQTLDQILWMGLLDGAVVTADHLQDPIVDGLLASELPTVLIGHRRADRTASYVDVDNRAAADLITTHLVQLGRRRIGHVSGPPGTVAGEDRTAGWRDAMARADLAAGDLLVEGDFHESSGRAAALELLDRDVDAIFCANDAMAAGALETIRARGLSVPDDVALAGFDDLEFATRLDPPLTTIRQGVQEQGAEAARMLLHLLRDKAGGPRRIILPTELVVRGSTVGATKGGIVHGAGSGLSARPRASANEPVGSE